MSNFTKLEGSEFTSLRQFRRLNSLRIRTKIRDSHARSNNELCEVLIEATNSAPEEDSEFLSNLFLEKSKSVEISGSTPGALRYLNAHLRIHLSNSKLWKEFL